MPLTVTCTCGLVYSVSSSRAGSVMACRCGRTVSVPSADRLTPPPATSVARDAPRQADDGDDTIHTIKRMLRTRELPAQGKCPHSGKPADDIVVFRLHFDPDAEEALAASEQGTSSAGGWRLFDWFTGKSASVATKRPPQSLGRDVWVDMPMRVAREAHAEILLSRSQRHFRDMLRTVPIYAKLLTEHRTARIEALPRHSDGQPTQGRV